MCGLFGILGGGFDHEDLTSLFHDNAHRGGKGFGILEIGSLPELPILYKGMGTPDVSRLKSERFLEDGGFLCHLRIPTGSTAVSYTHLTLPTTSRV